MKYLVLIVTLGFCCKTSILKEIRSKLKKRSTDFKEIQIAFTEIQKVYNIDLDTFQNLNIIRGVNVENGNSFGRIWNTQHTFHYKRKCCEVSKLELSENLNYTNGFDILLKDIEKENRKEVLKYAESHAVLSGMSWTIITVSKVNKKYNSDIYGVPDFFDHDLYQRKLLENPK